MSADVVLLELSNLNCLILLVVGLLVFLRVRSLPGAGRRVRFVVHEFSRLIKDKKIH